MKLKVNLKVNHYYRDKFGTSILILGVIINSKKVFLGTKLDCDGRNSNKLSYYLENGKQVVKEEDAWVYSPLAVDDLVFEYPSPNQVIPPRTYWIIPVIDKDGVLCEAEGGAIYSSKESIPDINRRKEEAIELQTAVNPDIPYEILMSILLQKQHGVM